MDRFFNNFLVVIVFVGILTRITNYLFNKKVDLPYLATFGLFFILMLPIVTFILGYGTAVFTYLPTLLGWLLIDHLHAQAKKEKK